MKVLIWIMCVIVATILNTLLGYATGYKVGYLIFYLIVFFVAKKLCEAWDSHKELKALKASMAADDHANFSADKALYCQKCGEKLLDNSSFCRKCGAPVTKD